MHTIWKISYHRVIRMSMKTRTVVKFADENTVEAVSTTCILGSSNCYWPPYARDKVVAVIKNFEAPNTHWPLHKMEVFRNGTFDSYLEARKKSNVAEYASDLNIDEEPATRKNRHKRANMVSSSSDDELPCRSKQSRTQILPNPPTRPIHISSAAKENTPPLNGDAISSDAHIKEAAISIDARIKGAAISTDAPNVDCCCCPAHKQIVQTGGVDLKKIKKQYLFMTNILADLKTDITAIKIKIESEEKQTTPQLKESLFMKFSLPIDEEGKLEELEEYLRSEENFLKTVPEIANMGGNSPYDFVRRSLALLITNKLAVNFSFMGKKQKASFSKLKLCELVIKAAEHSRVSCNRKETEESISKWLRRAKERRGN